MATQPKTLENPNVEQCTHCQYLIDTTEEVYFYVEDYMDAEEEDGDIHHFCTRTCLMHWLIDQVEGEA